MVSYLIFAVLCEDVWGDELYMHSNYTYALTYMTINISFCSLIYMPWALFWMCWVLAGHIHYVLAAHPLRALFLVYLTFIYHIYDVCPPSGFISHYGCVRICMRWWPVYVWSYVCPYVMAIHLILYYDVYALSSILVVLPWVLRSVARSEIFNLIDFRFWVQTENPMSDLFSDLVFSMFNWWWEEVLANWQWKSYK